MEFLETLLPDFDQDWIVQCEAVVSTNGGIPPSIAVPVHHGRVSYAFQGTIVSQENRSAMKEYLDARRSDIFSRFVVLHYLWAAAHASAPQDCLNADDLLNGGLDAAQVAANERLRRAVRPILDDFVDQLPPESIPTAEQVMWEFNQAVILLHWERLKRLAEQYRKVTDQPADTSDLMLARALWLPNSEFWAEFILALVSGAQAANMFWEEFIERGYQGVHFLSSCFPPESHKPALSKAAVIEAIACLEKVQSESLGPHWGILADCRAMVGAPEECAKIWEQHGVEILKPAADLTGRPADEILLLPSYQFPIADLWAEAGRSDKEIQVLESLRRQHPRLAGVNRRLAECYLQTDKPDFDAAIQRVQEEAGCDEAFSEDSIVRLLLRQCGNADEADRRLKEAREKYENSPSSGGQRTAIRNVLQLSWKPFVGLSPRVQEDWVKGLQWCYGEHTPDFDETERAEEAIYRCCRAFENHLRERLFEPLCEAALPTEIKLLPNAFEPLRSFLEKRSAIALTAMLDAVSNAGPSVSGVVKRLWDLLGKRSFNPYELRSKKYLDIARIRNRNVHESRPMLSGLTLGDARHCIELCTEFLSVLETPPPRPGRPSGTLQGR